MKQKSYKRLERKLDKKEVFDMVYISIHKRESVGGRVHKTMAEKKSKEARKAKKVREGKENNNSLPTKLADKTQREKIEAEYLVPEVSNWIETDSVRSIKEKIKRWLSLKYPVHIVGPTGCGKTILALQIAKELGRPTVWINGDEGITTTDLTGGYSQVEISSVRDRYVHNVFKDKDVLKAEWVDNPLTLACKYGYTLIYNEFSRARAVANNIFLSIFSEGILELPTKFGEERYIRVHPDFRVIFTSNSIEYAGVHRAQDALLDRMISVYMDYYDKETEAEIIASQSGIEKKYALIIGEMLQSFRKNSSEKHIGTRSGVMVAQALKLINNYNKETIKQLLGDVIISKTKNLSHFKEQMKVINKL